MAKLYLFNKPFGVLSQFSDGNNRPTLADYINTPNIYPAGRLDRDSEGLLLLTAEGRLQHWISHPNHKLPKTYWAQVEGVPDLHALSKLRDGITLNDGPTRPADVRIIDAPSIWERTPAVRFRASIATTWIELTIAEGRNRQVRRMTAAVGYPTLRLIRTRIGDWSLENLPQGQTRMLTIKLPAAALSASPPQQAKHYRGQNKRFVTTSKTKALKKSSRK